jgi:ABC-type multidrug transport system fused ATPase/permease subunit
MDRRGGRAPLGLAHDPQGRALSLARRQALGETARVVLALVFLAVAKAVTIGTPFLYKAAVDALAGEARAPGWLIAMGAVGDHGGLWRGAAASVGFNQLRDAVFARVAQRALRQLALETFQHIHALSLRYHITRKTGGLAGSSNAA